MMTAISLARGENREGVTGSVREDFVRPSIR